MNLTIPELAELPLAAALFDAEDAVIARTPEWQGARPGAVSYPVRNTRLVVSTGDAQPDCETLMERLLEALERTARVVSGRQRLRVIMLAASLRLMAGRRLDSAGTSQRVLEHALAGISARTGLAVHTESGPEFPVRAPEVVALVLVQIAVNAERHAGAAIVTIAASKDEFQVIWPGASGNPAVVTARRRAMRERWGMGFARIAADTLGGAVYPPSDRDDGCTVGILELGLNRLALPLAALSGTRVLKATRAWDEETGLLPGHAVAPGSELDDCRRAAAAEPGHIIARDGWRVRATAERTWIAIPPDGILDRARDVLDGMVHERALWDEVPEPDQSRVFALASLLAAALGTPLPRVPGEIWNRRFPGLAASFGVTMAVPRFEGIGAVDPRIAAFLAAELGEGLSAEGDNLSLRLRREKLDDPMVRLLPRPEEAVLALS